MRQTLKLLATSAISIAGSTLTLAQVTPPPAAPAEPAVPPAAWYEAYGWWIVLAVIIIVGLGWYFARRGRGSSS